MATRIGARTTDGCGLGRRIKVILEEVYPETQRVILVYDNLNTHTLRRYIKLFQQHRRVVCVRVWSWVYTPKHGSWLNIAEIELSVLTQQCLCRRIPDLETLRSETQAWQKQRNAEAKGLIGSLQPKTHSTKTTLSSSLDWTDY